MTNYLFEFQVNNNVALMREKEGSRIIILPLSSIGSNKRPTDLVTMEEIDIDQYESFNTEFEDGRIVYTYAGDVGLIWNSGVDIPSGCVEGFQWIRDNIFKRLDPTAGGKPRSGANSRFSEIRRYRVVDEIFRGIMVGFPRDGHDGACDYYTDMITGETFTGFQVQELDKGQRLAINPSTNFVRIVAGSETLNNFEEVLLDDELAMKIMTERMMRAEIKDVVGTVTGRFTIGSKDTNPKDAVGTSKWRQFSVVPMTVIWELAAALLEGARKYGRHNYRVAGVRSSVYIDAAAGHMGSYWEGEDIDADSGLHHVTKAIASLTVLRDAMIQGKCIDDRPPKTDMEKFKADMDKVIKGIFERHPNAVDAYLEGDQRDEL